MYNKLFTKILDSSIWLEPTPTRIVWLTLLAAMDEDGMVQFASTLNLAHRARVTPEEAEEAVRVLENPDEHSSDTDHEGRRIERVPGGWLVLNAQKYASVVTRSIARERTRQRVAKHRARKRGVTCNAEVTPSVSDHTHTHTQRDLCRVRDEFGLFWALYPPRRGRREGKALALAAWQKLKPDAALVAAILDAVRAYAASTDLPVDAVRWLKGRRWEDEAGVAKAPPKPKITMTPEERARWDAKQMAR